MSRAIYQIQQIDRGQYEALRTEDDFQTMEAALARMGELASILGWRGMRVIEIVGMGSGCVVGRVVPECTARWRRSGGRDQLKNRQ